MKKLIFIICSLFLIPVSHGAAPLEGKIKLKPLVVEWDESIVPLKMQLGGHIVSPGQSKKVTIPRKTYPGEKLQLLVIPKGRSYAPVQIPIPNQMNKIYLNTKYLKKIEKKFIWLWGQTPKSECGGYSSLAFRFLNRTSIYNSVSGLFAWKINRGDLPKKPVLYITAQLKVDSPKAIEAPVFFNANQSMVLRCQRYHGSDCPFVFSFKKDISSSRFRLKIEKAVAPPSATSYCPV